MPTCQCSHLLTPPKNLSTPWKEIILPSCFVTTPLGGRSWGIQVQKAGGSIPSKDIEQMSDTHFCCSPLRGFNVCQVVWPSQCTGELARNASNGQNNARNSNACLLQIPPNRDHSLKHFKIKESGICMYVGYWKWVTPKSEKNWLGEINHSVFDTKQGMM